MEFSLNKDKINLIKMGITHVSEELQKHKQALADSATNPKPEPLVFEHLENQIQNCNDLYLNFANMLETATKNGAVLIITK